MTWFRVRHYLGTSLWFVPILCVLAGVALSFGTIGLDRWLDGSVVPKSLAGDPNAALAILTTVAASMVTLTGLVLTITMVVVQLAIGQFSPRVLRAILYDKPSQLAIGVFVATFAHSILVMREVKEPSGGGKGYVPALAIVVSFVLIIVSIMVLVAYVNHIGQSLRVASIIQSVGDETRGALADQYPERRSAREPDGVAQAPDGDPDRVVGAPSPGVVFRIDIDKLVTLASERDVVVAFVPHIGDFVPEGAPLARVFGAGRIDDRELVQHLSIGKERTMHQDVAFGFRMLVDVAVRSISQAIVDPTTTTQAIDRIHDCLRQLVVRPFPTGLHADDEGRLRLIVPQTSWEAYVSLSVDELRHYAGPSPQVTRRLQAMLEDLLDVAPPERRPPLEEELRLVAAMAERNFENERDIAAATVPDAQGIGSAPDGIPGDEARESARVTS